MRCSFVLPAHDEEDWIRGSVAAIRAAVDALALDAEIIVAADACTDRTAELAREGGARVVEFEARQIAAARNRGAAAATGEVLFFVDADTEITTRAVEAALRALADGAIAGGSTARFDGPIPFHMRVLIEIVERGLHLFRYAGGCFLFCDRAAFEEVGGFDERYYAAEEIGLAHALKRLGRFVVVKGDVLTSARKVRSHSLGEVVRFVLRSLVRGPRAIRRREGLELWYGDRRADPGRAMGAPPEETASRR